MSATKALSQKDMNGLRIINLGAPTTGTDAATKTYVDTSYTNAISRANHTGTQTAATISNFDAQVRTSRLDQLAAPTASVNFNNQRQTSVAEPTAASDGATKNYVDNAVSGLVSGQTLKGTVRVATSSNVSLSSPGATIDGVSMTSGDVILLMGQSTASQNGPYVWTGASTALTRASNWDTSAEAVRGSYWVVTEGSNADSFALLTTDTAITLGTTALAFTVISVAGAAVGRFAGTCPATAAGGTWTVNHNLGSQDVVVNIRRTASPYDSVDVYWEATDANSIQVKPDLALASGEYTIVVKY